MEVENEALAFGQAEDLRRECVRKVEASLRGMEGGDEQGDIPAWVYTRSMFSTGWEPVADADPPPVVCERVRG